MKKQVKDTHYNFKKYMTRRRWSSLWYQVDEALSIEPENVLEIGPGPGLFKSIMSTLGVSVETLDLDEKLNPDYLSSAENMPFNDNSYDVVCAFQMLEHVPYQKSINIFKEMSRVSSKRIIISLPDARPAWPYSFYIPKKGVVNFIFNRPWAGPRRHKFDGQHYWELNKKNYDINNVVNDLKTVSGADLVSLYRVRDNPYHHFFVFENKM